MGLVYKNLLVDARDRWEIDQAAPQLFFSFFCLSTAHDWGKVPKSREKRTKNLQPASGMGVTILMSGKKKCWLSSWFRLLLHFYFSPEISLEKAKLFKCSKSKLNFNELCLIVKITKNSNDWVNNIMIHVCSRLSYFDYNLLK